VLAQPGAGLQLAKGAAITIGPIDPQQVNPMYYKQTDETAKFEQVGIGSKTACSCRCRCHQLCFQQLLAASILLMQPQLASRTAQHNSRQICDKQQYAM
jgi:hypothetical protein